MSDYIDEEKIRKRVIKRMEERQGLLAHAAAYIIINLIMWGIWLSSGGGFPWPIFITGGWGIGMFAHINDYWSNYGGGVARREEQIQREIERERERLGLHYDEKPKHDDYEIGSDGELFYDEDDERLTGRR